MTVKLKSTFKILLATLCLISIKSNAQSVGSSMVYGGPTSTLSISTGGRHADASESLYIGPGTYEINGVWEIYSKNVVIDPAAVITGTGSIKFMNPSVAGGASSPTFIDGNNLATPIGVNISHENASGLQLTNLNFPADLVSAGFQNITSNSTLYLGNNIDLAVDGSDITLGTGTEGNLKLNTTASILNYRPERMIITNNSIVSHLIKENPTSAFVFPIGISDGNYTPAQVIGTGVFHASVQDNSSSTLSMNSIDGNPNRVWHIFAESQTTATVTFQHNLTTESGTFSSSNQHTITQYDEGAWRLNTYNNAITANMTTGSSLATSASSQTLSGVTITTGGSKTYFTKTDLNALPVKLVSFDAKLQESQVILNWTTSEQIGTAFFSIERSADSKNWEEIGQKIMNDANTKNIVQYRFEDMNPMAGIGYYRLKMVDLDKSYSYSIIKAVNLDKTDNIQPSIYPNPSSDILKIKNLSPSQISSISILSQNGQIIQSHSSYKEDGIDIRSIQAGFYLVQIKHSNNLTSIHKLVIRK